MLKVFTLPVGPLHSNCYILNSNDNRAVVIDPGDDFEKIDRHITSNRFTLNSIILTHGHFDHFGALNQLCEKYGCNVYIHSNDVLFLKDAELNLSSRMNGRSVIFDGTVIPVTEQTVSFIGADFRFIHTPGHTPGSVCILVEEMLFTGDTLFNLSVGNSFSPYGDLNLEIKSIKDKLFMLNDVTCYPGHGEKTSLEYEKKFNPYIRQGETWI